MSRWLKAEDSAFLCTFTALLQVLKLKYIYLDLSISLLRVHFQILSITFTGMLDESVAQSSWPSPIYSLNFVATLIQSA